MKTFVPIAILVVILAAAGWWYANRGAEVAAVIRMEDAQYVPDKVTIKRGQAIRFENASTLPRWPASNIHPTHEIYPAFDPKREIAPGESWTFVFDHAGIWRFHDHIDSRMTGSVTVE